MVELTGLVSTSGLIAGRTTAVDPAEARDAARDILDGSKYQEPEFPRPFKGILEWMADRIRPVVDFVGDVFEPVVDLFLGLPGGRFILAAIVVVALVLLLRWLARRRSRSAVMSTMPGGLVDLRSDPGELDAEAERAESAGDHALAVRRRYEAGLLRLVRTDRLVLRPETTPGAAARQVAEPAMDELTADFEQIVYGGRNADADDSARARRLWTGLIEAKVPR